MDEEMEDAFIQSFEVFEVDIDYEFDAPRFFDFTRSESLAEAQAAEMSLETAGSDPPSPYIAKLNLREDVVSGRLEAFTNYEDMKHSNSNTILKADIGPGSSLLNENGWMFSDQIGKDLPIKTKTFLEAPFSCGSTLMKPTASHLAKQRDVKGLRQHVQRLHKVLAVQKNDKTLENPTKNENQASKRQKLENGQLCKVFDTKQQVDLMHKVPAQAGPAKGNTEHCRLKLTIPRGPELHTSQRARMIRNFESKGTNVGEGQTLPAVPTFKAYPLNKRILDAPTLPPPQKRTPHMPQFQEFDLKKSKKAVRHSSFALSLLSEKNSDNVADEKILQFSHQQKTSSILQLDTSDAKRSNLNSDERKEESATIPKFKARPLNKKIFSSKGDIGIFRTNKKEITVPREFNFMTEKRFQPNPPTELFNKLSLTSEPPKQSSILHLTASQPIIKPMKKNSKENIYYSSQQRPHKATHKLKGKLESPQINQTRCQSGRIMAEISSRENRCR